MRDAVGGEGCGFAVDCTPVEPFDDKASAPVELDSLANDANFPDAPEDTLSDLKPATPSRLAPAVRHRKTLSPAREQLAREQLAGDRLLAHNAKERNSNEDAQQDLALFSPESIADGLVSSLADELEEHRVADTSELSELRSEVVGVRAEVRQLSSQLSELSLLLHSLRAAKDGRQCPSAAENFSGRTEVAIQTEFRPLLY